MMPARTGKQYLADLAARPRTVWLGDARISDVTAHPAFARTAQSIADLYDLAAPGSGEARALRDDGNPQADGGAALRAYTVPRGYEDLVSKRVAHDTWARSSFGFLGRSPDYMAAGAAGWAARPTAFTGEVFDGATN
jgi:4-hydroxyphenylacetate 3-monooxygenase